MKRNRLIALLLFAAFASGMAEQALAKPAVARPTIPKNAATQSSGTVFFTEVAATGAIAAIGTAHTLRISDINKVGRVEFRLGGSWDLISTSTRLFVSPGIPFTASGGTVAGDFFVYALDSAPSGIRVLELETDSKLAGLKKGDAVQILGIPAKGGDDQVTLPGKIWEASPEQIQVNLEESFDLRGWGGAPVIATASGRVIGILQASVSKASTPRLTVGPIHAARNAVQGLHAGTAGQTFAKLADTPAVKNSERAKTHAQPLLVPASNQTNIHLEIEFPGDGAVVSDSACGTFVAGRAMALDDRSKRFDVALVLDTSGSTRAATGADVDGDGVVGMEQRGRISSFFGGGSTDEGDSVLAAEVAAARQILRDFDPRTTRVAVVTFAGGDGRKETGPPALTRQPLTSEYARVEQALDFILRAEPHGQTHISGAVDHATMELLGLIGSRSDKLSDSEKLVFFFTDGQPTLPYGPLAQSDNTRAVRRSAMRANKAGIRIHSFAIGPEALAGPIASVELADMTGGSFIPVRHPGELSAVVEALNFANLEEVILQSDTTGNPADPFRVTADGSWGGFVKMVPGSNTIRISARSTDGIEAVKLLHVVHEPVAQPLSVPADLGLRHNRLLEDCLRNLKQVRVEVEKVQAEKVRKELLLEIGKERAKARKRAAEQRKQLELEIEDAE
ncbi:MAG: VWA domain-containing protein [Deltaproteobacteria bacterium]|nr:VWA domain-containing protein [Deltaproteobacteria bacterium]